jgi:hypothetical protein
MPRRRYRVGFYRGRISEETRASIRSAEWCDHIFVHAMDSVHARLVWQSMATTKGLIVDVTPAPQK